MLNALISMIQKTPHNDVYVSQRRFPRRQNDACICVVNGVPYPVENWSMGGALLSGDGRLFGKDQSLDTTLKFRLSKGIFDINLKASVVRSSRHKIALSFQPIYKQTQEQFQIVLKNLAANI